MRKVIGRYGEIYVSDSSDLISDSLALYGEWAQKEFDLIANFVKAGDTVLDVGANLGALTRAFSHYVGELGRVLAFEPLERNFSLLTKNCEIAELANIEAFKFGLGDVAGRFNILVVPDNLGASRVTESGDNIESIEIRSLDEMAFNSQIGFIKIDVEGMELAVLKGASQTIKKYHPRIFLEVNSLEGSHLILKWASEHGYNCYGVVSEAFNSQNVNGCIQNIFDKNAECGLILISQLDLENYTPTLEKLNLPKVLSVHDLALILFQKPQYLMGFSSNLVRRDRELLLSEWSSLKAELVIQKNKYEESARQISALNNRIQQQGDDIHRIQSSRSWRLTEPLRLLAETGRNLKNNISRRILRGIGLPELPASPDRYILKDELPILRTKPICVVLPVYKDKKLTLACIKSAMPGIKRVPEASLVIINDASPEPGMAEMLNQVASDLGEGGRIKLITNTRNLGFVASVNCGISSNLEADVVLLNSDVILPHNWLERLATEAYSLPNIGTVTPLSNNTTICTFPEFLQDNTVPFDLKVDEVDQVFCSSRLPNIEAPTGVGFCMYIRRQCIDEVGVLSKEHFGRGYGEENDFCQRAIKAGWRNIITPNLYAFHQGGVSFGPEKAALIENASKVLHHLHPNYHADAHQFIKSDPLKKSRIFRLINLLGVISFPKIVHVSHGVGGGVDQHIIELSEYLYRSGQGFSLVLKPDPKNGGCTLKFGWKKTSDEMSFRMPEELDDLAQFLGAIGVSLIHYHHVLKIPEQILNLASSLRVPHRVTIHDFYLLAANPTLTNEHGLFDYSNPLSAKNPLYPLPEGETPESWRERYRPLVEGAEIVIFPSAETRRLFGDHYKIQNGVVASHLEANRAVDSKVKKIVRKSWYKISVLGALGKEKGADYLDDVARFAQKRGLPWSFELIGYAYKPLLAVTTLGAYEADELKKRIADSGCDVIFFPARWPETYSYTLSSALESGVPIVAPKLGAFPERLSGRENALLFEPHLDPSALVEKITNFIAQIESGLQVKAPETNLNDIRGDYYHKEYTAGIPATISDSQIELGRIKVSGQVNGDLRGSRFRDSTLRVLVRLSWHPSIRWLRGVVPQRSQKFVRRLLSS